MNDNGEKHIVLDLNIQEGALVVAAMMRTYEMLSQSLDKAINEGQMKLAQMIKRDKDFFGKAIADLSQGDRVYSSSDFTVDINALLAIVEQGIETMNEIDEANSDTSSTEEVPKQEDKGNVVSFLDRFKKEEEDK